MENMVSDDMIFNPHKASLNIEQLRNLRNTQKIWNFQVFECSDQSEVYKIILLKSSLREVRFNPHEVT